MVEEGCSSVRVALRVRPQLAREKIDGCRLCTTVTPGEPQIVLGNDKAFTYDYVFDMDTEQETVYDHCAAALIEGCLEGYNATILAYGQTGSGKTHTMGTGFDIACAPSEVGIIPRAVKHLFDGIERRQREAAERSQPAAVFNVSAQFLELYNEDIYDLLSTADGGSGGGSSSSGRQSRARSANSGAVRIHEDTSGNIYTTGVTSRTVRSLDDTMECLKVGALSRTTASTNMNSQSSRSHAIFTIVVKQTRFACSSDGNGDTPEEGLESLSAKFHFVDLAGSERLKRTGATGDRAKEGISINCGLLALGNVISALGDQTKRSAHVPYRDSKLTRLLQDSLGGNSRTIMIACISPSDRDFMETLNTLKYANRARNIKNKVVVNQDKTSRQLAELRTQIQALQMELAEYKQGKRVVGADGIESINDMFHENALLQAESDKLRQRVKALQETVEALTARNTQLLAERALLPPASAASVAGAENGAESPVVDLRSVVEGYIREIEDLRAKLVEAEAACSLLKRGTSRGSHLVTSVSMSVPTTAGRMRIPDSARMTQSSPAYGTAASLIEYAKKDVLRLKMQVSCSSSLSDQENNNTRNEANYSGGSSEAMSSSNSGSDEGCNGIVEPAESLDQSSQSVSSSGHVKGAANGDGGSHTLNGSGSSGVEGCTAFSADPGSASDDLDDSCGPTTAHEDTYSSGGSSSSSSEEDEAAEHTELEHMKEDLAELTSEISLKERLIDELERSKRQLDAIRAQYEEKLAMLRDRILATEKERDDVLRNLGEKRSASEEQVKKVKDDYEKKLAALQGEVAKLSSARREHSKLLRENAQHDRQLGSLQSELTEMKKAKVRLMTQMRAEAEKSRVLELQRTKELAQLHRVQRQKDIQIRALEQQKKERDNVLKRKLEEVELLRRRQRDQPGKQTPVERVVKNNSINLAQHLALQTPSAGTPSHVSSSAVVNGKGLRTAGKAFSPRLAKQKWDEVERHVTSAVARRQAVAALESDMDQHLRKREELSKCVDGLTCRLTGLATADQQADAVSELRDEIETLTTTISFVQGNIEECQNNIMQIEEEAKDEPSLVESLLATLSIAEARYMLEHMLQLVVSKGVTCSQKDAALRHAEARLQRTVVDARLREQLLAAVIRDNCPTAVLLDLPWTGSSSSAADDVGTAALLAPGSCAAESGGSDPRVLQPQSDMTASLLVDDGCDSSSFAVPSSPMSSRRDKARKKTQTTADLLFALPGASVLTTEPLSADSGLSTSADDSSALVSAQVPPCSGRPLPPISIGDIAPPAPSLLPPIDTIVEEEEDDEDVRGHHHHHSRVGVGRAAVGHRPARPQVLNVVGSPAAPGMTVVPLAVSLEAQSRRVAADKDAVSARTLDLPAASPQQQRVGLSRTLSGSYTVLNCDGEPQRGHAATPTAGAVAATAGDASEHQQIGLVIVDPAIGSSHTCSQSPTGSQPPQGSGAMPSDKGIVKKLPPRPPAKPTIVRSASLGSAMTKWRGSSNTSLDNIGVDGGSDEVTMSSSCSSELGERLTQVSGGRQPSDSDGSTRAAAANAAAGRKRSSASPSPMMRRKSYSTVTATTGQPPQGSGMESKPLSLPPSPTSSRKQAPAPTPQEDVFSRLSVSSKSAADRGVIESCGVGATAAAATASSATPAAAAFAGGRTRVAAAPSSSTSNLGALTAARIATGHASAVLSVCATRQLLFSGSVDRTCKIWDLTIGCETMSMGNHPSSVVRVRFAEATNMLFTVSAACVKVWDIRTAGPKCIKILSSSGLAHDDIPMDLGGCRQLTVQQQQQQQPQQGEVLVFDACLSADGHMLFTTAGSNVRMWDLRMYGAVGKVTTGHQGPVTALALEDAWLSPAVLCTGSKDHHVRTFELSAAAAAAASADAGGGGGSSSSGGRPGGGGGGSKLGAPHYDGVQTLALRGPVLFSGSRDTCIKKYDVVEQTQKQTMSGAHKDWVCDLAFLPDVPVLASCCRSGSIRLWDVDTCAVIDELRAFDCAINSMAIGGPADGCLFTGTSDGTIGIWTVDYSDLRDSLRSYA